MVTCHDLDYEELVQIEGGYFGDSLGALVYLLRHLGEILL